MSFETMTYPMKDLALPMPDTALNVDRGAAPKMGVCGIAVSGILMWLRLCVYVVTGYGSPFESHTAAPRQPFHNPNRTRRRLNRHCSNQKTMPVIRQYGILYNFGSRHITPTQFLERRCRLSGVARVSIYRMVYYAHRMVREALWARYARGDFRASRGLCEAHLWPS